MISILSYYLFVIAPVVSLILCHHFDVIQEGISVPREPSFLLFLANVFCEEANMFQLDLRWNKDVSIPWTMETSPHVLEKIPIYVRNKHIIYHYCFSSSTRFLWSVYTWKCRPRRYFSHFSTRHSGDVFPEFLTFVSNYKLGCAGRHFMEFKVKKLSRIFYLVRSEEESAPTKRFDDEHVWWVISSREVPKLSAMGNARYIKDRNTTAKWLKWKRWK